MTMQAKNSSSLEVTSSKKESMTARPRHGRLVASSRPKLAEIWRKT